MAKMKNLTLILITLLLLSTLLFLHQTSFSQSSVDRIPKEVVKTPLPKLLDFGRGKCIPCKAMAPILKELSEEYKDRVIIKIIEIDQEPNLTRANRIRLIPTQIFFDAKNQEIYRHEGFMGKEQIKAMFQKMGVQ
jgi:thioredoxin-like negative regulator of GroEL